MFIPSIISWIFITSQIICTFVLWDNYYGLDFLVYIGYGVWVFAALFGVLPIFKFKSHGGVKEGDSYMKTTKIVTSGFNPGGPIGFANAVHVDELDAFSKKFQMRFGQR